MRTSGRRARSWSARARGGAREGYSEVWDAYCRLADATDSGDGRSVAPATAAGADMAITSTGAAAAASSTATAGGGGGGGSAPKSDPAVVTRPQRVPPPARSTVDP